jgi:hypothetical protein
MNPINFVMMSSDSRKLKIECIERKPPKTVDDINFKFLPSSMTLRWQLPVQTHLGRIPIRDIKYVQVFERENIRSAFRLIKMHDFNDSLAPELLRENIPRGFIKLTTIADTSIDLLYPEKGEVKIYAIATVDAHGNSSPLSAQYAVYLDSLNQPKIEFIAFPGSPKQYPNLTMRRYGEKGMFTDAILASDYKKVTLYHNPEFTVLQNGGNDENKLVQSHGLYSPDNTGNEVHVSQVPSYVLQLIDVETQKDEKINIFVEKGTDD